MYKVMLIEDDRTMLMLLSTLLQFEGFEVCSPNESSLNSMLDAIRQQKPDVTLLDVNLRQGSGIELMKSMRADPDLKGQRVLMTSGLNYNVECRMAGADSFLLKPFMPDELIDSLKKLLGNNHNA